MSAVLGRVAASVTRVVWRGVPEVSGNWMLREASRPLAVTLPLSPADAAMPIAHQHPGLERELLFDDDEDPFQMENLAGQPESKALQEKLDAQLHAALKKIGDDFRTARSYIEEWGYNVGPFGSVPYGTNAVPQSPKRKLAVK